MIVYREVKERASPRGRLEELQDELTRLAAAGAVERDVACALLIEAGVLEAAILDTVLPRQDDDVPLARELRTLSLALGHVFHAMYRGGIRETGQGPTEAAAALDRVLARSLPAEVTAGVPEGYAWYALYPETYLVAAERWAAETRPARAVVLGLRSIGTSLSTVVAAAIGAAGAHVLSFTLRPHGHPFDRRPNLAPGLLATLAGEHDAVFLIVDEGPGLSGSSLCGTAAFLSDLGVRDERIVLVPSWVPDGGAFVSAAARARWPRHRKLSAGFEEVVLASEPFGPAARDLSGGGWRPLVYPDASAWPAVQPQHERRKYLAHDDGDDVLWRFAGLGRWGGAVRARAERLATAGFGPEVVGFRDGFLGLRFVPGRPLPAGRTDGASLARAVDHLAFRHAAFRTGRAVDPTPLLAMIRVNVEEGLGPGWTDRLGGLDAAAQRLADAPAVIVDGRMQPHEWVEAASGELVKVDALDHGDDHFLPGPTDIAWDVVGLAVEHGWSEGTARDVAEALAARLRDPTLPARLPFHRLAYAAFRLGYTTLAVTALGDSDDGRRMRRLVERYRAVLIRAVERWSADR